MSSCIDQVSSCQVFFLLKEASGIYVKLHLCVCQGRPLYMSPKKATFLFIILAISSLLHLTRSVTLTLDVKLVHGIFNICSKNQISKASSSLQMYFLRTHISHLYVKYCQTFFNSSRVRDLLDGSRKR